MALSQTSAQALARLRTYNPPPTQWHNCPLTRRAAVLILLFPDRHGALKVVLTMRSAKLNSYAGQAAFPGGKADTLDESPWAVARREAWEEIGLPLDDEKLKKGGFKVEQLCELPANLAKTELGVRPCVAYLSPLDEQGGLEVEERLIPRLDPKEVAAVFTAPFHSFLRKTWEGEGPGPVQPNGKLEKWYRGAWTDWNESRWRMHNFYVPKPPTSPSTLLQTPKRDLDLETLPEASDERAEPNPLDKLTSFRVWGMTARIVVDAARIAYGEEPEFEHNNHHGDEEMIERLLRMGRLSEERKKGDVLTKEVLKEASKI
ncbi:hypothetical protein HBH98_207260 [Parastagonospora nodorum]|nr:hypothetical protein HBH53_105370 [Parastagonospora nodorum]KAH3968801.1 hypothetical protein HBH51_129270 [Parastagonospora nodorum]KAH3989386.1 hypothetical protein HBH52_012680 [Parastagonospora nodorum]KAH4110338.1 hypothetical protein HBH46_022120 [Parastagonospora nodorum]KAH4163017.1 hypothetical protein HBH43_159520 [Parastagonospora nodorum]